MILMDATPTPTYVSWTSTDSWIVSYWFILVFTFVLVFCQCIGLLYNSTRLKAEGRQSYTSGRGGSNRILIALFVTYACCVIGIFLRICFLNRWPSKQSCAYLLWIGYLVYVTMKAANYFFFLQRYVWVHIFFHVNNQNTIISTKQNKTEQSWRKD